MNRNRILLTIVFLALVTFAAASWTIVSNDETSFTIQTDAYDTIMTKMLISTAAPVMRFTGNTITSRTVCTLGAAAEPQQYYWTTSQQRHLDAYQFTLATRYIRNPATNDYAPEVFDPANYGGISSLPTLRPVNYPSPDYTSSEQQPSPAIKLHCTNTNSKITAFDFVGQIWGATAQSLALEPPEPLASCGTDSIYCRKYYNQPPIVEMFAAQPINQGKVILNPVPTHFRVQSMEHPVSNQQVAASTQQAGTNDVSNIIMLGTRINMIIESFDGEKLVPHPEQNEFVSYHLSYYDAISRRFVAYFEAAEVKTTFSRSECSFVLPKDTTDALEAYMANHYALTIVLNYRIRLPNQREYASFGNYVILDQVYLFPFSSTPLPAPDIQTTLLTAHFTGITAPPTFPFPSYRFVDSDGTHILTTHLLSVEDPSNDSFLKMQYHMEASVYFGIYYDGMLDDNLVVRVRFVSLLDATDVVHLSCEFNQADHAHESTYQHLNLLCSPRAGSTFVRSFHAIYAVNMDFEFYTDPPTVPDRERVQYSALMHNTYLSHTSCERSQNRFFLPYRFSVFTDDYDHVLQSHWVCTQCPHATVEFEAHRLCNIDYAQFKAGENPTSIAPGKTLCPELYELVDATSVEVPTEAISPNQMVSLPTGQCKTIFQLFPNPCGCVKGECQFRKWTDMEKLISVKDIDTPSDIHSYLHSCHCEDGYVGRYCQIKTSCNNIPSCAVGRDPELNFDVETGSCNRSNSHCDCPASSHDHSHYDDDDEGVIPTDPDVLSVLFNPQSRADASPFASPTDDDDEHHSESHVWEEPNSSGEPCFCTKQTTGYCHKENTHPVSYSYQRCHHNTAYSQPHLIRRNEVGCSCKPGWAGHDCSRVSINLQAFFDHSFAGSTKANEDIFYLKPSAKYVFIITLIAKLRILMGNDNVMVEINTYRKTDRVIHLLVYTMPQKTLDLHKVSLPYSDALPSIVVPDGYDPLNIDADQASRDEFFSLYHAFLDGERISAGDDSISVTLGKLYDPHCARRANNKPEDESDPSCLERNAPPSYLSVYFSNEQERSAKESEDLKYSNWTPSQKPAVKYALIFGSIGGVLTLVGIVLLVFYCHKTKTACFYPKGPKRTTPQSDLEKMLDQAGLYHELSSVSAVRDHGSRGRRISSQVSRPNFTKSIVPNAVPPPSPLPEGWIYHYDDNTNTYFYINLETLQSQHNHPLEPEEDDSFSFSGLRNSTASALTVSQTQPSTTLSGLQTDLDQVDEGSSSTSSYLPLDSQAPPAPDKSSLKPLKPTKHKSSKKQSLLDQDKEQLLFTSTQSSDSP